MAEYVSRKEKSRLDHGFSVAITTTPCFLALGALENQLVYSSLHYDKQSWDMLNS
jgi:hypothetical protein